MGHFSPLKREQSLSVINQSEKSVNPLYLLSIINKSAKYQSEKSVNPLYFQYSLPKRETIRQVISPQTPETLDYQNNKSQIVKCAPLDILLLSLQHSPQFEPYLRPAT